MALQLGDVAADFRAETTEGTISFHEWLGDRGDPVLAPEGLHTGLHNRARRGLAPEERVRKARCGSPRLAVDSVDSHERWVGDIADASGPALNFPLIADSDRKVSDLYAKIHPNASDTLTGRSVFVMGPHKKVKLTITYPASTGRNVEEILRVLDSLQLTAGCSVATAVNWHKGEDVIIVTAVSDEDAKEKIPKGFRAVKSYLRHTPRPKL